LTIKLSRQQILSRRRPQATPSDFRLHCLRRGSLGRPCRCNTSSVRIRRRRWVTSPPSAQARALCTLGPLVLPQTPRVAPGANGPPRSIPTSSISVATPHQRDRPGLQRCQFHLISGLELLLCPSKNVRPMVRAPDQFASDTSSNLALSHIFQFDSRFWFPEYRSDVRNPEFLTCS